MQHRLIRLFRFTLQSFALLLILLIPASLLLSFKANRFTADIWQQLGISREKGSESIRASFMNGYLHYYGVKNARNILAGDRAAIARDLMNYAHEQMHSEAFKKFYEQERKAARPQEPDVQVKSKETIRAEKIAETEKSIRESEANMKNFKPDMVKALQPVVEMLKNNLKEYQNPNSKMIDIYYQSELMNKEGRIKSYEESMKRWEENYPADYKQLIKSRLQHFIQLAKTVDFSAELKEVNGRKKFVNPVYEGKAYDWKQIYRAGKEVILPAISFAEQWVKELN
jgi:F0F1-type ATP synthase membrane subunit b/b'